LFQDTHGGGVLTEFRARSAVTRTEQIDVPKNRVVAGSIAELTGHAQPSRVCSSDRQDQHSTTGERILEDNGACRIFRLDGAALRNALVSIQPQRGV
jgi:hypothetical protein